LKLRTQIIILAAALAVAPFLISIFIFSYHATLGKNDEQYMERFLVSKWIYEEFYPSLYEEDPKKVFFIPTGIELSIINEEGVIVFSNIPQMKTGMYFNPLFPRFIELIKGKDSKTIIETFDHDGKKWQFFFVYSEIPEYLKRHRFGGLKETLYISLYLTITGLIAGYFIVRSILRRTGKLEEAIRKVSEGQLDFEIEEKGEDELSLLIGSFDSMRLALKEEQARKSRFIMAVSHDLKTPLTSIKGYVEAIQDGLVKNPETLDKYVGIISEKSVVLEERISSLIDFARMETGEWKIKYSSIELNIFLERLSSIYREDCVIMDKKYRYENLLPEKVEVTCDPVLFERALENLFVNSVKHTLSGTEIFFRASIDNMLPVIELGDNGDGIDGSDLKYIFEPFYRGTNSRKEPGMGLGLSTAKSVLDAHGWNVTVSSEKGRGTVFRIVLEGNRLHPSDSARG